MPAKLLSASFLGAAMLAMSVPAAAQYGGWGGGWGSGVGVGIQLGDRGDRSRNGPKEGKVEVTRFVAPGAALGSGGIRVVAMPSDGGIGAPTEPVYEAAVLDRLGAVGYATATPEAGAGQVIELRVLRDEIVPPDAPRNPVSGSVGVGTGTYGSGVGVGLNIDLTKPRKAMTGTTLEARIRDRASGAALWEGRATIATRDGNRRWTEPAIAAKLAEALFAKFPGTSGETLTAR